MVERGFWRGTAGHGHRVALRGLADDSIGAAETDDADRHVLRQGHEEACRPPLSTETISPTTTWTSVATRPEVVGFSHRLMPVSIERPTDQRPGPFLLSWAVRGLNHEIGQQVTGVEPTPLPPSERLDWNRSLLT